MTAGSDHADADQQEKAEAQAEQEGAGSRAEMLQEGLGRTHPISKPPALLVTLHGMEVFILH